MSRSTKRFPLYDQKKKKNFDFKNIEESKPQEFFFSAKLVFRAVFCGARGTIIETRRARRRDRFSRDALLAGPVPGGGAQGRVSHRSIFCFSMLVGVLNRTKNFENVLFIACKTPKKSYSKTWRIVWLSVTNDTRVSYLRLSRH